jgi:hypothetical protein
VVTATDRFTVTGWQRVLDQVGEGPLVGKLAVDQVYAKYQHERLDLHHPRGGGPKYLEGPLFANHQDYWQQVADALLDAGPEAAMVRVVEGLNTAMSAHAPVDLNNLRKSGSPSVTSNGRLVYERKARQRRLTREELKALRRGRGRRR